MNFDLIIHDKNDTEVKKYEYRSQACFGALASYSNWGNVLGANNHHMAIVRYFLLAEDSKADLDKLAKRLGLVYSWGVAPMRPNKNVALKDTTYIDVNIADLPENYGMYCLFMLRNHDKYFHRNQRPIAYTLYKEKRISLYEAVAISNLICDSQTQNMGKKDVVGCTMLGMYNSLLIWTETTVADFRRFIKNPSDTKKAPMQTFRELKHGYSRDKGSVICTHFQRDIKKIPHNTTSIRELATQFEEKNSYVQDMDYVRQLINHLLSREVIKKGEKFEYAAVKAGQ